jgi:hypothetical protein
MRKLMTVELDHMFVCTGVGAPEADRLVAFGLSEGAPNTHPGQGTACRRFFFANAMLELLWVHDEREARSSLVAPTQLWERWSSVGYSPFGICVRQDQRRAATRPVLPFATWAYRPPYLPPEVHIDVASETANSEPMMFAAPIGGRPDAVPTERRQPLVHPRGLEEITGIDVTLPQTKPVSRAARALHQTGAVSFSSGNDHLAEIEFDQGGQGQSVDFRPLLPLRFRW